MSDTASRDLPHWTKRAIDALDFDLLHAVLKEQVETPSPTGAERACAEKMVTTLRSRGIDAHYQAIDAGRGNCIARLPGSGDGMDLLLYGHFDTSFTGDPREDFPVLGRDPRPDLEPVLRRDGDLLTGLGISNPKGGAVCAAMALDAVRRAAVPLRGDVVLGLVAGGIHKRPIAGLARDYEGSRYQGFGIGCEYMLKHGITADAAISTKPGYSVVYEEPGECWFQMELKGKLLYSGMRRIVAHRNPIIDAGRVVEAFEAWLPGYTERHTRGQVSPVGAIGAIEAGWPYKPEFIPAICRLYANLHTGPCVRPQVVRREFAGFVDSVRRAHPDIDLTWEMLLSQPGSHTRPDAWIVAVCTRAWEGTEGRTCPSVSGLSGTTDGNLLRNWGIPTVRLGLPGLMSPEKGWPPMFDACREHDLRRLTEVYVRAIVDACTRPADAARP